MLLLYLEKVYNENTIKIIDAIGFTYATFYLIGKDPADDPKRIDLCKNHC